MFDETHSAENEYVGSFAEALSNAHAFTKNGMTLFLAGMSYAKKGGTLSEFRRIVARLLAEANMIDDTGDQSDHAEKAKLNVSSVSPPKARGSGQSKAAQSPRPPHVTPIEIKNLVAQSIFDTCKMRDGRDWRYVNRGELARIEKASLADAAAATQDARIAAAILKRCVAPDDTNVIDMVSPTVFAAIVKEAQS